MAPTRPTVWSIAGNDSGGGAGLSADQRAAEAMGVHLCPVVASLTAQNSVQVAAVLPVDAEGLDAQLKALAEDLPPVAIKTGLIGSAAGVAVIVAWVDRLRATHPRLPLVVDPVLRASTGAALADEALLQAYVRELLPRTTVLTPNRAEARRLVAAAGLTTTSEVAHWPVPELAAALRGLGPTAVIVTGGDLEPAPPDGTASQAEPKTADIDLTALALDWIDTAPPVADAAPVLGWLSLPRVDSRHTHGTGCTHATTIASALALGFPIADAAVLAKMATTAAIEAGHPQGRGAGPVGAPGPFITRPHLLPRLTWGDDAAGIAWAHGAPPTGNGLNVPPGLYALANDTDELKQGLKALGALQAPLAAVQLRIKRSAHAALSDAAFEDHVRAQVKQALPHTAAHGVRLFVNDHWRVLAARSTASCGSGTTVSEDTAALGVHLGQEDLEALGPQGRAALLQTRNTQGLALGISSHSLWELCRALSLRPDYVACGPVWPTVTKDMPWNPQGLDNLAWWSHMSPVPVVAIGGILAPGQMAACRTAGAHAACLVRAMKQASMERLAPFVSAWTDAPPPSASIPAPHPCLP